MSDCFGDKNRAADPLYRVRTGPVYEEAVQFMPRSPGPKKSESKFSIRKIGNKIFFLKKKKMNKIFQNKKKILKDFPSSNLDIFDSNFLSGSFFFGSDKVVIGIINLPLKTKKKLISIHICFRLLFTHNLSPLTAYHLIH